MIDIINNDIDTEQGLIEARAKHREALVIGQYTDVHPVSSTYTCSRSLTADAAEEKQGVANHRKCRGAGQSGGGGDDVSVPPPELCVQGYQQQQHRTQEKGQNWHGGGGFATSSVTIKPFTMN